MKSIVSHWFGFGNKMINLARNEPQFLKNIFVLCKMLDGSKL
jgi:hypothetical protein